MLGFSLTSDIKKREAACIDVEKRLEAWAKQLEEKQIECLRRERALEDHRLQILKLKTDNDELVDYIEDARRWYYEDVYRLESEKKALQQKKALLEQQAAKIIADARKQAHSEAAAIRAKAHSEGRIEGLTSGKKSYRDLLAEIDSLNHRLANARHAARRRSQKEQNSNNIK